MKYIEEAWESYLRSVVNPLTSPEQMAEIRRVFFAGAMSMFVTMTQTIGDLPNDSAIVAITEIDQELMAYSQELQHLATVQGGSLS